MNETYQAILFLLVYATVAFYFVRYENKKTKERWKDIITLKSSEISFIKEKLSKDIPTKHLKDEYLIQLKKAYDIQFKSFKKSGFTYKTEYLSNFSTFVLRTLKP